MAEVYKSVVTEGRGVGNNGKMEGMCQIWSGAWDRHLYLGRTDWGICG